MPVAKHAVRLQQLLRIAKAVNSNLNLDTVLQTIVDTVCEETDWKMACIAVYDVSRQEVSFAAQRGFRDPHEYAPRWAAADSLTPRATEDERTIVVPDTLKLKGYPVVVSDSITHGFRSVVIAPLLHAVPPAALWLCRDQPCRFTREDVAFSEAVAEEAALAVRNAALYQREKARAHELATINHSLEVLLEMVLADQTVEELRRAVSSLLGNPVWIVDRSGLRIPDVAGPPLPQAALGTEPVWSACGERTVLAVPVVAGTVHFGWVVSWDSQRPFADLDLRTAQQGALIFALTFLRERVQHEVESQLRGDLFTSLISPGGAHVGEDLRQRAVALKVELPLPARVCLFDVGPASGADGLSRRTQMVEILHTLGRKFPHRLSALQDDCVAMLLGPGEESEGAAASIELASHFRPSRPRVAVGEIVHDPGQYIDSFRSAQKVLKVAQHLALEAPVLRSEELGVYALLFDDRRSQELDAFRTRTLGALSAADVNGSYWHTLDALCANNFQLRATARSLCIHISTLQYRLARIRSLLGLDWDKPAARLELELAVAVERWHRAKASFR